MEVESALTRVFLGLNCMPADFNGVDDSSWYYIAHILVPYCMGLVVSLTLVVIHKIFAMV
jgi:hypothetical protein